jgi:hypothetical protein
MRMSIAIAGSHRRSPFHADPRDFTPANHDRRAMNTQR